MRKTRREKGSKCVHCKRPVEVGQVVYPWNEESDTHVNCDDPFSLNVDHHPPFSPAPVVLLDRPMRYVLVSLVSATPKASEDHLLNASVDVLHAFSEGVVWNDEQRSAYTDLHAAVSRFKPELGRFKTETVST